MARLEEGENKVEELQTEVERLKKSLKRKQNKKILTCGSCFLVILIIILVLLALIAYALAQSGLVNVPFFTEKFYQEPKPSCLVKTEGLTETEVFDQIQKVIVTQAATQKKTADFEVVIDLSEGQLTTLIREEVRKNSDLDKKIDYLQMAILSDNIELFLKTKEPQNVRLTLAFKPSVKNGKVNLETKKVKIGNLSLPKFVAGFILSLAKSPLNSMLNSFNNFGQIQDINIRSKIISLDLLIKNTNFK